MDPQILYSFLLKLCESAFQHTAEL